MNWEIALSVAASIIAAFAGAAFAALFGFRNWRKQRWIERRVIVAEETLTMFYEAKTIIVNARSPGSFEEERKLRPPIEGESERQSKARDSYYPTISRLYDRNEFFGKFEASKYKFMALFGDDKALPFGELISIRNKILYSCWSLIQFAGEDPEERQSMRSHLDDWRINIGWGDPTDDPIIERLDAIVTKVEEVCLPLLRRAQ